MSGPTGRWVMLDSYTSEKPKKIHKANRGGLRRASMKNWGVLVAGHPHIGQAIGAMKRNGTVERVYVKAVVIPADKRGDGKSLVTVSNHPVAVAAEVRGRGVEQARMEQRPSRPVVRNPRICEECEGPCRPGAGVCDSCRAEARDARLAVDGVVLRPGPEPEDVF